MIVVPPAYITRILGNCRGNLTDDLSDPDTIPFYLGAIVTTQRRKGMDFLTDGTSIQEVDLTFFRPQGAPPSSEETLLLKEIGEARMLTPEEECMIHPAIKLFVEEEGLV